MFKKTVNFGIVCDLHLGHNPFSDVTPIDFLSVQHKSLMFQLHTLHENGAHDIVFAGDTFETPNPSHLEINTLLDCLNEFRNTDFYFYLGNHEIESNKIDALILLETVAKNWPNLHVIRGDEVLEFKGIKAEFLSWPETKARKDSDIIFLHNEFKGAFRNNGSVYENGADFEPEPNQLFVSGHLHLEQSHRMKKSSGYIESKDYDRYRSGLLYPGRFGGSRHEKGNYDSFVNVKVIKGSKGCDFEIIRHCHTPFWFIAKVMYKNRDEYQKDVSFFKASNMPVSIIVDRNSKYIPEEETMPSFMRIEKERASTWETSQEIVKGLESSSFTKRMGEYTESWINGITSNLSKFQKMNFNSLRKRIDDV